MPGHCLNCNRELRSDNSSGYCTSNKECKCLAEAVMRAGRGRGYRPRSKPHPQFDVAPEVEAIEVEKRTNIWGRKRTATRYNGV